MDTRFILDIILIIFSTVIGTLLALVLHRVYMILGRVENTLDYIDHVREIVEMWERIPLELLKKFMNFWSK